jgi:hypothetical protein
MATFSVWARRDSTTAKNETLNPNPISTQPAAQLTFTDSGTGDLLLEYNGGLPDPDTQVIIGGSPYSFTVSLTGTLPSSGGTVPEALYGRQVVVIRVIVDGQLREYFFVLGQPPATEEQMNQISSGAIDLTNVITDPPPICFGETVELETPVGRRRVCDLRAGDAVLTEDGRSVTIAWIGVSCYGRFQATADPRLRPVHLHAHALGRGLPDRDLVLSPQHRVVVEGPACELLFGTERVFVIARHLPLPFATWPEPEADVRYYHLLLENHEIVVSNGLPTESFQPARRMIETLSEAARCSLMAVLKVLGTDAMLSRPDALPTLNSREARVLMAALSPAAVGFGNTFARPEKWQ